MWQTNVSGKRVSRRLKIAREAETDILYVGQVLEGSKTALYAGVLMYLAQVCVDKIYLFNYF